MARTRTGKKLLTTKAVLGYYRTRPILLLEQLGRFVYLGLFYFFTALATGLGFCLTTLLPNLTKKGLTFSWHLLKTRFFVVISFGLFFGLAAYFYLSILQDLPTPNKLITRKQALSTKIYDRNHQLLFTIFDGNQDRTLVKLDEIPEFVKQATISIEDKEFYRHTGFSFQGIARAIYRNLSHARLEGGSTITQQLIKNALLTPERTYKRKVKEVILSIEAEVIFSKDEILQMYFNEVPYGGTAYGIEQASQKYFGKSIKEVNLAEAALLAGLPAAPTKYSPYGANPQLTLWRQHQVLNRIVEDGYLSRDQAEQAKKEKVILAPQETNILAPHFVMYVKELLVQKYGSRLVEQGGLEVVTSLDLAVQQIAEKKVTEEMEKLKTMRVSNAAVLITKPQTGEILGMVGSKDYYNTEDDGNVNLTTSLRQPGSAIKVVTYALAMTNGYTPATVIPDSAITYYSPGSPAYSPINYDNRFHGNVTLRTALASSYNVPAVKTLANFGVDKMIDLGEQMGITTWKDRSRFGLSLTLGAGEVKMTEMAVVYGTLANLGQKTPLKPILKLTDAKGKVYPEFNGKPERVLQPQVAFLVTDILKDNQARTPAFGPTSLLNIPNQEVAVKTGTTNDKRDNWTIGYTQDLLAAVWVGNNDNTPMSAVASGITGASPIWNHIMLELLKDKTSHFQPPANLIKANICTLNGLLACEGCPTKEEYFLPGTEPKIACNSAEIKRILEAQEKAKQDKILEGISTQQQPN